MNACGGIPEGSGYAQPLPGIMTPGIRGRALHPNSNSIIWGSYTPQRVDVTDEFLRGLGPLDGVQLVESIVHADAGDSGIPSASVSFPHAVNTTDGGVDGRVKGAELDGKQRAIRKGLTCYQIKTGNFQPTPTKIRDVLFNKNTLRGKVRECFDSDGTFILVLAGRDDPVDNVLAKIQNALGDKYKSAKIDVWTQSILRGFIASNSYLRLRVLGIDGGPFKSYEEWREQDDMAKGLEIGHEQQNFICTVRRHLDNASAKHLRIVAAPGMGKTRLVLEALKPKRFSTACIYVDRPSEFAESPTIRDILKATDSKIFLVVDECDHETTIEMWNKVKRMPKIKLVTIYNEPNPKTPNMVYLDVPRLDDEHIANILKSYDVPGHRLAWWCSTCGRSPRAAHVIGESLRHNPDQTDQTDAGHVWDLYIASKTLRNSDVFVKRKKILRWISAFRRIGFDGHYRKEYLILQKILRKHEKISLSDFTDTVKELKDMRILQGDTTLYITPAVLHLHLWREWHERYYNIEPKLPGHDSKKTIEFSPEANMLQWRTDMFWYAKEMGFRDHAANLFSEGGYADAHRLLESEFGAKLFFSLAKADVRGAVDYIDRRTYCADTSKLKHGKRWMAITLLGAAMKRELFDESARLLLSLAKNDDSEYGDLPEMFAYLFIPMSGRHAQTEVPPSERLSFLREEIRSSDVKGRNVVIRACDTVLKSPTFAYSYGQEELWENYAPWTKSNDETSEYYGEVLKILHTCLEYGIGAEMNVTGIILKNGIAMLGNPAISETVVDMAKGAYKERYTDAAAILGAILTYIEQRKPLPISEHFLNEAGKLLHMIVGPEYQLLVRWAVTTRSGYDPHDDPLGVMKELARRSLDINVLGPQLGWLVTDKAVHGYDFGRILGSLDDSGLLRSILDAQRQSGSKRVDFLAGYVRSICQRNEAEWEGIVYELCGDAVLRARVPEIVSLSGITDGVAARISDLIREGAVEPSSLEPFTHSNLVDKLSEHTFEEWMRLLQGKDLTSRQTRMRLYYLYYAANKRVLPASARDVLLSGDAETMASDPYQPAYWCEILKAYVLQRPGDADTLSAALEFAAGNPAGTRLVDAFFDILYAAAAHSGEDAWGYVAALLESAPPGAAGSDEKLRFVSRLLHRGTLVDRVSLAVIFDWMDADAAGRAPLAARVLPTRLDIAVEMVSRYGGDEQVRDILGSAQVRANRKFVMFGGTEKIKEMESFRENVTDPAASRWLGECIAALERSVKEF